MGLISRLRFARDHRWSPKRMSDHLDADLAESDRERLERHLRECPECAELLRELKAMVRALGDTPGGAGDRVALAVLAAVRERLGEDGLDAGHV